MHLRTYNYRCIIINNDCKSKTKILIHFFSIKEYKYKKYKLRIFLNVSKRTYRKTRKITIIKKNHPHNYNNPLEKFV